MKRFYQLILITIVIAALMSSCKVQHCPANDRNWFYKEAGLKPFKKVNQLRCYKMQP